VGPEVFYLAKSLQAIGMVNLMVALYAGVAMEHGMALEYALLGTGVALFVLGRYLEPRR
jgi:hypothetical protein